MSTQILDYGSFESLIPQEVKEIPEESFEDLYTRHYRRVYSLCLRMTANVSDAEDLAHDVFLQVQRKLASFRGDSAFTTWLHHHR
jgi:RNA polymerase sigma-70 factor, ECF subfamily